MTAASPRTEQKAHDMTMDLTGRRLLVVGASTGIGKALAMIAVRRGANVVFAARRRELLDAAVAEVGGGHVVVADTTNADDCTRMLAEAAGVLGEIDLLVYAVGMSTIKKIEDWTADDWSRVMTTNVIGASLTTAAALPYLSADSIVAFMSSDTASRPRHSLTPYAASKAALETTIKGWRMEHPDRRFVNIVVGPTASEFGVNFDMAAMGAAFPEWMAHGEVGINIMTADGLASMMLNAIGSALAMPDVDMQEIVLRPPGRLAKSVEDLMEIAARRAETAPN